MYIFRLGNNSCPQKRLLFILLVSETKVNNESTLYQSTKTHVCLFQEQQRPRVVCLRGERHGGEPRGAAAHEPQPARGLSGLQRRRDPAGTTGGG